MTDGQVVDGGEFEEIVGRLSRNRLIRSVGGGLRLMIADKTTLVYFLYLLFILLLGIIGPMVAPYSFDKSIYVAAIAAAPTSG